MIVIWLLEIITKGYTQCAAYTCKLPTDYVTPETCVYYKENLAIPTYYAAPCYDLNKNFCPASVEANSSCQASVGVQDLKFPGEKCHFDANCGSYTKGCKDQVCQGLSLGQACKEHSYCAPGLRCNKTCQPQLAIGDLNCVSDYDCVNNAGCDIGIGGTKGTCVEYWTVQNSAAVQQCVNNSNWLCASSTCVGGICVAAVSSLNVPQRCYRDSDCGSNSSNVVGKCVCGKNRNANMYCQLFNGDEYFLEYFGIAQRWMASGYWVRCNTMRRLSYVCAGDWWDRKESYLMNYYYYFSSLYPSVIEYDQCIAQVYLSSFLSVQALLGNILITVDSSYLPLLPLLYLSL